MYKVSAGVVWTPFDDVAICVCLCVLGLGLHVGRLEIAKRTRIREPKQYFSIVVVIVKPC